MPAATNELATPARLERAETREPIARSTSSPPAEQTAQSGGIHGMVLVDGAPPGRAILLKLCEPNGGRYRGPGRGPGAGTETTGVLATLDGQFAFVGVPDGWRGGLEVPPRYRFTQALAVDGDVQRASVKSPSTELVFYLEQQPGIHGRLVSALDGQPIPDGLLQVQFDAGKYQTGVNTQAEPDGTFFFACAQHPLSLRIDAQSLSGLSKSFEFGAEQIPDDLDLGDLALPVGAPLHLRVVDPELAPIQGALVRLSKQGLETEVSTDAAGEALLQPLPPEPAPVEVIATGFDVAMLQSNAPGNPVEVVLQPTNQLTVRVLDMSGRPLSGVSVRIASEGDLFKHDRAMLHPLLAPKGKRRMSEGVSGGGNLCIYATDESGTLVLQALRPDQPLTVDVVDGLLHAAHSERIPPLGAQEQRELTIKLQQGLFDLDVLVGDSAGSPIPNASVWLTLGEAGTMSQTGSDGRSHFNGLFAGEAALRVTHPEFVGIELTGLSVSSATGTLSVALDRGRTLLVRVLDAQRKSVASVSLGVFRPDGTRVQSNEQGDGDFSLLKGLPQTALEVRAWLAGREYSVSIGANQDDVELIVPVHGRLEVDVQGVAVEERKDLGVHLISADAATPDQWIYPLSRSSSRATFEAVLPGSYAIALCRPQTRGSIDDWVYVDVGAPVNVQVAAGATASAALPQ